MIESTDQEDFMSVPAKKALAVIGDFYHSAEIMRNALESLSGRIPCELRFYSEPQGLPRQALENADLLLLARMGRLRPEESEELWLSPGAEQLIFDFVASGGSLLALHAALASYPAQGPLHRLMRGRFLHHPPLHPGVRYLIVEPAQPVTRGVEDFTVADEQYFVEVDRDSTTMLLLSRTPEHGESPAGWAHELGTGRVCVLVPGHTEEALLHAAMQKLLGNALSWCLRM
jgi:hypothetical protein